MKKLIATIITMLMISSAMVSAKARIDFVHKYNSAYNCSVSVSKLKIMSRMMPAPLKREIGLDYYPQIISGLKTSSDITVKDVVAHIDYSEADTFEITLNMSNATVYIRNATWEELDEFFGSVL